MKSLVNRKQPISVTVEEKIAKYEIEFHQIIFDAAGCEFTDQIHSLLGEYFFESSGDRPHRLIPTAKDMDDHIKLVKAIAERNVGKAVDVMVDHIRHILGDESQ